MENTTLPTGAMAGQHFTPETPVKVALRTLRSLGTLVGHLDPPTLTDAVLEKREFETTKAGTQYLIPHYHLVPGKGIEKDGDALIVNYVRGVTDDPNWPQQPGVLNETLLEMIKADLTFKANEVPDDNTLCAIEAIKLANMFLAIRQIERTKTNVLNTSQQTPK